MSGNTSKPGRAFDAAWPRLACTMALALVGAAACSAPAWAQLVSPPTLPGLGVTREVGNRVDRTLDPVERTAQFVTREARIHALLRTRSAQLEADPNGAPIVRARVLAISPSEAALSAARAEGFAVLDDRSFAELELRVVSLAVPRTMRTAAALRRLRELDPSGRYDFDHIYLTSSSPPGSGALPEEAASAVPAPPPAAGSLRVGLVDGGVDEQHPVFQHNAVRHWACAGKSVASAHGTAVASLLVGQRDSFNGAAAGATLYAADVFCAEPTGGAVATIAGALAWMAGQRVAVVNISLVGPDNALLEQSIRALQKRGHLIVAAVGNDGPAAPPLYPAAYAGVVGVTAVDAHRHALLEAARGPQVRFSARADGLPAAGLHHDYVAVRGTSFAAPIVAGLLAMVLMDPDRAAADAAVAQLSAQALDLGSRGMDTTYGAGLVGEAVAAALSSADLPVSKSSGREWLE